MKMTVYFRSLTYMSKETLTKLIKVRLKCVNHLNKRILPMIYG